MREEAIACRAAEEAKAEGRDCLRRRSVSLPWDQRGIEEEEEEEKVDSVFPSLLLPFPSFLLT